MEIKIEGFSDLEEFLVGGFVAGGEAIFFGGVSRGEDEGAGDWHLGELF